MSAATSVSPMQRTVKSKASKKNDGKLSEKEKNQKAPVNIWLNPREIKALEQIKGYFGETTNAGAVRKALLLTGHIVEQVQDGRILLTAESSGEKVREILLL